MVVPRPIGLSEASLHSLYSYLIHHFKLPSKISCSLKCQHELGLICFLALFQEFQVDLVDQVILLQLSVASLKFHHKRVDSFHFIQY